MIELAAEADIADGFYSADLDAAPISVMPNQGAGAVVAGLWRGNLPRVALTLAVAALFVYLLSLRLNDVDIAASWAAVAHVPPLAWAGSVVFTAAAFWAVGHYDAVLHRHFETGVNSKSARVAGISAIAVSQTLGLGVVTGSVLRWRMMPDQSFWLASRITLAVALSFLAGWAIVTAGTVIVLGAPGYVGFGWAVLVVAGAGIAVATLAPRAPFRWPNLFTIGALLALCSVDVLAAASALYVLLPQEVTLSFAALLPAFLLAYGAGLLSGSPGGIGAFELTLLALLPQVPAEPVLVAIMGWRLIYFVLPALIGAAVAMRGPQIGRENMPADLQSAPLWITGQDAMRSADIPSEYGLLGQGEHSYVGHGQGGWMVSKRGHVVVGLLDPALAQTTVGARSAALASFQRLAKDSARWPALYKVSAPMASAARRAGWHTVRMAREAVLFPRSFDLNIPARAGLRRKLRRADSAGLCVRHVPPADLPWPDLDALAANWARTHGVERGFSMGRYARAYVAGQRVYVACLQGKPVGFATFHQGARAWTLDLMRYGADLPDGGMHALVHQAVLDAAGSGAAQVSLAAAPEAAFAKDDLSQTAASKIAQQAAKWLKLDNGQGLRRFKDSFAPEWQSRYFCAPHVPAICLAAASIARAVVFPKPLQPPMRRANNVQGLHNRFALWAAIWHARGNNSAN
jgi:phosphatidylglycerol lysyltransferase